MSLREIVRWPDPRLAQACVPVGDITAEVRRLADDMLETMYAAEGRGLAAPQVGVLQRLFVMDAGWKQGPATPQVMINPEIREVGEAVKVQAEGCLSIPGLMIDVARPGDIRLRWTDVDGERQEREFTGFEALCVQHEIDHLEGRVTLDHLAPEERARVLKDYSGALA